MDKKRETYVLQRIHFFTKYLPTTLFIIYGHDFMLGLPYELKVLQN